MRCCWMLRAPGKFMDSLLLQRRASTRLQAFVWAVQIGVIDGIKRQWYQQLAECPMGPVRVPVLLTLINDSKTCFCCMALHDIW